MKNYKYVFSRIYPFYKKKKLTETEMIERNVVAIFTIMPTVLLICTVYNVLRRLKVIK